MEPELRASNMVKKNSLNKELIIPWIFVLMWSSGAIFVELGLSYADPFIFLSYRFFFAMVILWIFCLKLKPSFPTNTYQWRLIVFTGLFQQVGYQAFFFLALDYNISPGLLAIILGAQPVTTTILTKAGASRIQWVGLSLGMIGLILVVLNSILVGTISLFGIICCILSLGSITYGTILQKKIKISLPINMAIQYTCSFIVFIIVAPFFGSLAVDWSITFWVSLLWMVLIITVGATMLLYYMISKGNLTNVTSLFYCVPPLTAILDYLIFGNILQLSTFAGLLLIVIGLILINKKGSMT
ncbi:DMT family transporter [Cytobacillus sp. NCCP-133]|uniref:DMT family transporter n=1 Tax=Cytobacillus sp. NCCP-133 TaxID=766848 RepID=UPI0022325F79|nr:DMT family transporter [Cytobacillus sp. NCCP-133]